MAPSSSLFILRRVVVFALLFPLHAAAAEPELHVRSGLPHLAALARDSSATGELRVAYLGGSITAAADGWRSLTTEHLQKLFPKLTLIEIPAGLPGTGSNLGACRVGYDVLRHRPDLLFVEFAVNDTGVSADRIERTIEGIVRQTRRANPQTDLCFIYTVSAPGLPELEAGNFPPAARAMETVAAHYGIPSLHLGVEIARRVSAHALDFKNPSAPASSRTFSLDGVHPTAAGHRIYAEVIARSLPALLAPRSGTRGRFVRVAEAPTRSATPDRSPALPPPLHADNWETATLILLDHAVRTGDWTPVAPDDPNLRGATKHLLPPAWRAATPGAAIEFTFTGRHFGLLGIAAPDSGNFAVTIDDLPSVTATFFDAYATPTFCRQREWFFPTALAAGSHRARIELLATPVDKAAVKAAVGKSLTDPEPFAAQRLTLCGALVVGSTSP